MREHTEISTIKASLSVERTLEPLATALPWLWLLGSPVTFALTACGLIGAERLRRGSRPVVEGDWPGHCRRLSDALGVGRRVGLAVCDRLAAPVLVGVLRPLILLPTAALSGWGPEQIEMVLLHELAHVRRWDNLVNLFQRLIESALFFHPAVWWASGWARLEREHCCDRVVVEHTGRARAYAATLAALAMPGASVSALSTASVSDRTVLAMAERAVVARIRLILNTEDPHMKLPLSLIGPAAALLVAPALWVGTYAQQAEPGDDAKPEQAAAPPALAADPDLTAELFERAIRGVEVFNNTQDKASSLTKIAAAQARAGDRKAAKRTYQRAFEAARSVRLVETMYLPHVITWISGSQITNGFPDEARETLREALRIAEEPTREDHESNKGDMLRYHIHKVDLLTRIMEHQKRLGDQEAARATYERTAQLIGNDRASMRRLQSQFGDLDPEFDFDAALKALDDTDFPENEFLFESKSHTIGRIIGEVERRKPGRIVVEVERRKPENGRAILERLVPAAKTIKEPHGTGTLLEIAEALTKIGQPEAALRVLRSIDPATLRTPFNQADRFNLAQKLARTAAVLAKTGDAETARTAFGEAIEIAQTMDDEP